MCNKSTITMTRSVPIGALVLIVVFAIIETQCLESNSPDKHNLAINYEDEAGADADKQSINHKTTRFPHYPIGKRRRTSDMRPPEPDLSIGGGAQLRPALVTSNDNITGYGWVPKWDDEPTPADSEQRKGRPMRRHRHRLSSATRRRFDTDYLCLTDMDVKHCYQLKYRKRFYEFDEYGCCYVIPQHCKQHVACYFHEECSEDIESCDDSEPEPKPKTTPTPTPTPTPDEEEESETK